MLSLSLSLSLIRYCVTERKEERVYIGLNCLRINIVAINDLLHTLDAQEVLGYFQYIKNIKTDQLGMPMPILLLLIMTDFRVFFSLFQSG